MDPEDHDNDIDVTIENDLLSALNKPKRDDHGAHPPDTLYIFPLVRRPFFPGMAAPIIVEPGPFYEVLKLIAKSKDKYLGLLMTKSETQDIYTATLDDFYTVGVLGRILRIIPLEQGGAQVILSLEQRMTIMTPMKKSKHLRAKVSYHRDHVRLTQDIKAYTINIISTIKELLKLNPLFREELQIFLGHSDFTEPGQLADFSVALTTATREELQGVLETFDLQKRIDKALSLLRQEVNLSQLQSTINQKIEAAISKTQREFFLREQLKTIKRELGIEKEDKQSDREKFEARIKERKVPKDVQKVIDEEFDKLSTLEVQSAEYGVARSYLDWLTVIPWGINSQEDLNLKESKKILEADHHGLEDIKQRILEFIGVGKLSGSIRGSIICLVGPPGVGKTSIGRSIARALQRKFYRFSVGGMRDEAEIKGHRRTYVGAMPGKLVQALKHCQTMNPVIMLDEVDKMGSSYHGDPAAALLEVLDPEQNKDFLDHYMDVRLDLSDVLFIVTANVLDNIPPPLRDRMDIMRLSGYIMEEKVAIATHYLIPRHRKEMGIKASEVTFTKEAIRRIINGYARESGVRNLENLIKKILRKVAVKLVKASESHHKKKPHHYTIDAKSLETYLGKPIFISDRIYKKTPPGVCTGLAWTAMGGAILYIECIQTQGEKTGMQLTGQAGDVMKESAKIAWSYAHTIAEQLAPGIPFFPKMQVHIHIPEGATPKDGPSAGITMVTALLSLLTDTPVANDLGMTGEITLTGRVLPIGGVKEKLVAARRSGLKKLLFPLENQRDYDELPAYIKKGIEVQFVETYEEVFKAAFPKGIKKR